MTSKVTLVLSTVLAPCLWVALVVEAEVATWMLIAAVSALPMLLIALGAGPARAPRSLLVTLWMVLAGTWSWLWWLSESGALRQPSPQTATLAVSLMLIGLGLVPLLLVGLVFGRTFSSPESGEAGRQLPEDREGRQ